MYNLRGREGTTTTAAAAATAAGAGAGAAAGAAAAATTTAILPRNLHNSRFWQYKHWQIVHSSGTDV